MWPVIFTCHCWLSAVSWSCLMANSECLICEIALQQISLHLLVSVQVISQWQGKAGGHKSHILNCRCDLNSWCFTLIMPRFSATHTDTQTFTHTDIRAQMGFHIWLPGGCSIGFRNTHNICKALWLIILVLQCNHAIWAWVMAKHEPYGKEKRWWGLYYSDEGLRPMATDTHRNTP